MKRALNVWCLPLALSACSLFGPDQYSQPWGRALRSKGPPVVVALERAECLGTCPVYRVLLREDGTVVYEGKAHVKQRGRREWKVPAQQAAELLDELTKFGVFSLPKQRFAEVDCTDQPTATLYVRRGPREVTVFHNYGDTSAPDALFEAENAVDAVAETLPVTGALVLRECPPEPRKE